MCSQVYKTIDAKTLSLHFKSEFFQSGFFESNFWSFLKKIENLKSNAIENETVSSIGSAPESEFQNCKATSVSFMNIPMPSAKSSAAQTAYR